MEPAAHDHDLIDPDNTGLGHRDVQRWNLPAGWVISARPAHPALVSEAGYVAVQEISTPRGPAGPTGRRYLLAGLLRCGICGRRLESSWSNGKPTYRCRHGYTSAARPDPKRPKNTHIREDQVLPRLSALAILLASRGRDQCHASRGTTQLTTPTQTAQLIGQLRSAGATLTYDPLQRTLGAETGDAVAVTVGRSR